jgi:hypothetical protein
MRHGVAAQRKPKSYQFANVYIQQVTLNSTAMEERDGWEALTAFHDHRRSEEEERGDARFILIIIVACPREMVTRNLGTQPGRHLPYLPAGGVKAALMLMDKRKERARRIPETQALQTATARRG